MTEAIPIQAADRVAQSRDKKNAAILWPRAIDARLDQLQDLATEAGERTTRAELAAALVCAAKPDGGHLRELLTEYRMKTNQEVLLRSTLTGDVVQLPIHRPGPRKHG